jgi:hypothetical protein
MRSPRYFKWLFGLPTLALFSALGAAVPTQAAEITVERVAGGDFDLITIKGEIKENDDVVFATLTRSIAVSQAVVVLDSPGGQIYPALEIAKIILIKNFGTYVEDASCASACALIWLAGPRPTISKNGRVGFHGAYVAASQTSNETSRVGNALIGAYLARLELSKETIAYITEASPARMSWLTELDAMRLGLTHVRFTGRRHLSMEHYDEAVALEEKNGKGSAAALKLYQQSADEGFAGAQNNLGDRYENGDGVKSNRLMAIYWYTRAVERGEPTAYVSLAGLLAKETDQDALVEAMKFAILAAKYLSPGYNKDSAVKLLKELTDRLPLSQRDRAGDLAARWVPLYLETNLISDDPSPGE